MKYDFKIDFWNDNKFSENLNYIQKNNYLMRSSLINPTKLFESSHSEKELKFNTKKIEKKKKLRHIKNKATNKLDYVVESILKKQKFGDEDKYLIKWFGYPHSNNTWEPLKNLNNCDKLLKEFEIKHNIPTYSIKQLCSSNIKSGDSIVNDEKPKNHMNLKTDDKILLKIGPNPLKIDKSLDSINNDKKNNVKHKKLLKQNEINIYNNQSEKNMSTFDSQNDNRLVDYCDESKITSLFNLKFDSPTKEKCSDLKIKLLKVEEEKLKTQKHEKNIDHSDKDNDKINNSNDNKNKSKKNELLSTKIKSFKRKPNIQLEDDLKLDMINNITNNKFLDISENSNEIAFDPNGINKVNSDISLDNVLESSKNLLAKPLKNEIDPNIISSIKIEKPFEHIHGSFEDGDKVLRVLGYKFQPELKDMQILVEWQIRSDGQTPAYSFIPRKVAFNKIPKLLLYYFESRLVLYLNPTEITFFDLPLVDDE